MLTTSRPGEETTEGTPPGPWGGIFAGAERTLRKFAVGLNASSYIRERRAGGS